MVMHYFVPANKTRVSLNNIQKFGMGNADTINEKGWSLC